MKTEIIIGLILYILPMLVILYTLYIFRFKVYMKSNITTKKTYPLYKYIIYLLLMLIPGVNIVATARILDSLVEEKNSGKIFIADHFLIKEF